MTDWRTYRITSRSVSSSNIILYLDSYVSYDGCSYKWIYCGNCSPFYNWYDNDFIEINNDVTRYRSCSYYFDSTNEVRLTCHRGCGHSHKEYEDLKIRYSSLERERNDLRSDRDEWRRKHEEIRKQLSDELSAEKLRNANAIADEKLNRQNTESTLRNEKARAKEKEESDKVRELGLTKLLEDTKTELSLIRVEKDNQLVIMANLRVEHEKESAEKELQISEKDNEIKEKEEKIQKKENQMKTLRGELGLSQEELLEQKIRLKQRKLETFAGESIDSEQVQNLCDYYEEIIHSRFNYNRDNIRNAERKILKTKQEISRSGIKMEKIQKLCHKCEKMAKLKSQLDQILVQQYEAKQEVPVNI